MPLSLRIPLALSQSQKDVAKAIGFPLPAPFEGTIVTIETDFLDNIEKAFRKETGKSLWGERREEVIREHTESLEIMLEAFCQMLITCYHHVALGDPKGALILNEAVKKLHEQLGVANLNPDD